MLFKTYNTVTFARLFFNGFLGGSLLLGLIALYGLSSGAGIFSTLCGFLYIVLVSLLSLNKIFRSSPFSILICFFTFLYLNIPTAFILVKGNDFIYGSGLTSIPFAQSDYQQSLPWGFLCLSVFWVSMWLGIISGKTKRRKINQNSFSSIRLLPILLIGLIVGVATWIDNQSFANVFLTGEEKANSLLAFIFFDHAYLLLAGVLLFYKLNEFHDIVDTKKITFAIFVIFFVFFFTSFMGGGKAAVLVVFMLLLFFPFILFSEYPNTQVILPSTIFFVIIALLAPLFFYGALLQRMSTGAGIASGLSTLITGITAIDASVVYDIVEQIFYRFAQGGIDRFLLVFQSFIVNAFDQETSTAFVSYLAKNTLNLLLPGTPFPESYTPSSQLFPQVIQYNTMLGDMDRTGLILSLNTQPYTIFGVFMIIFGLAAPVYLYLFTSIFIFIFNRLNNVFFKISMLYFFFAALASYGIEVVLGNSVHLFVSILLMYFFIKILSQFHVLLPAKSNCIVCTQRKATIV